MEKDQQDIIKHKESQWKKKHWKHKQLNSHRKRSTLFVVRMEHCPKCQSKLQSGLDICLSSGRYHRLGQWCQYCKIGFYEHLEKWKCTRVITARGCTELCLKTVLKTNDFVCSCAHKSIEVGEPTIVFKNKRNKIIVYEYLSSASS